MLLLVVLLVQCVSFGSKFAIENKMEQLIEINKKFKFTLGHKIFKDNGVFIKVEDLIIGDFFISKKTQTKKRIKQMSHIVTLKTELKNMSILQKVCDKLNIKLKLGRHKVSIYHVDYDADASFKLPGWEYPVAIKDDEAKWDCYNGSWGKIEEFTKLQDEYLAETTREFAYSQGFCTEERVFNGELVMTLSR